MAAIVISLAGGAVSLGIGGATGAIAGALVAGGLSPAITPTARLSENWREANLQGDTGDVSEDEREASS